MAKHLKNKEEDIFRSKLENFEFEPSIDSWQIIQNNIKQKTPTSTIIKNSGFLVMLLFAIIGIGYTISVMPNMFAILKNNKQPLIAEANIIETNEYKNSTKEISRDVSNDKVVTEQIELNQNNKTKLTGSVINAYEDRSTNIVIQEGASINKKEAIHVNTFTTQGTGETITGVLSSTINTNELLNIEDYELKSFNDLVLESKPVVNKFFNGEPITSIKKVSLLESDDKEFISKRNIIEIDKVKPNIYFGLTYGINHTLQSNYTDGLLIPDENSSSYNKSLKLANSLGVILGLTFKKFWQLESQFIFFSKQSTNYTFQPGNSPAINFAKIPNIDVTVSYLHLPLLVRKQFNLLPNSPNILQFGVFSGLQYSMLKTEYTTTFDLGLDVRESTSITNTHEFGFNSGVDLQICLTKAIKFRIGLNTIATNDIKYLFKTSDKKYNVQSGINTALTMNF